MDSTAEEAFLDSLYGEEEHEEEEPVLFSSQVITQAKERPTYYDLAQNDRLISTLNRKPVLGSTSASLHATNGGVLGATAMSGTALGAAANSTVSSTSNFGAYYSQVIPEVEADAVSVPALQHQLNAVVSQVESQRAAYEQAVLEGIKTKEMVHSMEDELNSLVAEESKLSAQRPPAPERLKQVRQWIAERTSALDVQGGIVESNAMRMIQVEAKLRAAESELDFMAEAQVSLDRTLARDADARTSVAASLRAKELRTGQAYKKKLEAATARVEEMEGDQAELKESIIQTGFELNDEAKERLKKSMGKVMRNAAKGKELAATTNESRRLATLELKGSLETVKEEVAAKAARYRQVQKQKKEMQEKEFQDLHDQGLNPYEVYRRRDVEAAAQNEQNTIHNNIAERQVSIAQQLALEEAARQKVLAAKDADRAALERFKNDMSATATEMRTETYIRNHTIGNLTMLDPTGRLPVDPSAVTVFKTNDFGLGRAEPKLLERMLQRHPHVTPNKLLLPNKYHANERVVMKSLSVHMDDDDDFEPAGGDSPPMSPRTTRTGAAKSTATGMLAAAGGAGSDWKEMKCRPLTKLEKGHLEKAKERHRSTIGKAKEMMGTTFGGDAFMSTPDVVVFKDFEVGRTYTQKVSITNRSYEKNTYRVVEIPPEHGNVLEVNYKLPGYLATGVSGELLFTYTPKLNEDIETAVVMLADTGPFNIPVLCLTKKADMSLSTPVVDFGPGVTLAESASRMLVITNSGALDVEYTIVADVEDAEDVGPEGKLRVPPFIVHQATGQVPGYGTASISIVFVPTAAKAIDVPMRVCYKAITQRKLFIPPSDLTLRGIGREVPIFLEEHIIDFGCCMVDHSYRDYLPVRNGGKTAMKVNVVNRHDVCDYFEFSPDFGFVQANEAFPIVILFKPKAKMLNQCSKFLVEPTESGIFEIPMKLNVPDQKLPVNFTLRAQVTTSDLIFDPPELDFGPAIMNESTGVRLMVSNPSALPQTFGFVGQPPGVIIKPNDGFGYVLPGETVERIVSFQPPITGPQTMAITAKTLAGRTFTLQARATGVQPSLSLSHNRLRFPATPVKDTTLMSVILRNNTDTSQAFEFGVPPRSDLAFIPRVGEVKSHSTMRVQIEYSPQPDPSPAESEAPPEAEEAAAPPAKGATAKKAVERAAEVIMEEEEEEEAPTPSVLTPPVDPLTWYRWHACQVACYIRPPGYTTTRLPGQSPSELSPGPTEPSSIQALHLNVETCAVQPDILLQTELKEVAEKQVYELDFGPVPVGQRITRTIEIYNQSPTQVQLRSQPLDCSGVFQVVNSLRVLKGHSTFRVLLSFMPQLRTEYLEIFTIRSPKTRIRLALKGQGIAPELQVTPPEALTSGFDLGDVMRGDTKQHTFSITNVCPFPLNFQMRFGSLKDPNFRMQPPFYCKPAEGTLAQGEAAEVTLVFQPSNQLPYFKDQLQIYVPNQQENLLLPLSGRCWEEGIFIAGPQYPPLLEDPFMEGRMAAALEGGAAAGASKPVAAPRLLTLTLDEPFYLGETATTTFQVGSMKSAAGVGANGEVILEDLSAAALEAGWSIEPLRTPLAAGDLKTVTVKFVAPAMANAGMAAYFEHAEHVELRLDATLTGGLPAPPTPEGRKVQLLFRAPLRPGLRPSGEPLPSGITETIDPASAPIAKGAKKK